MSNTFNPLSAKVIEYMKEHKKVDANDISTFLGKSRAHAGVILSKLCQKGKINRVGFGKYSLNNNPVVIDKKESVVVEDMKSHVIDKHAYDTEILLRLKETHGREELIKVLRQWIKILE